MNGNRRSWFVGYRFTDDEYAIKEKLSYRADTVGFYFTDAWPESEKKDIGKYVWLQICGEE